jgi:hypothetical protein
MPRRVCALPQNQGADERQAIAPVATSGWDPAALRCEQNDRHRDHSGGSRDRTAPRMERHRRP